MKRAAAASCAAGRRSSFPFKFAERRDDVARTVLVEQFPSRLFASARPLWPPRSAVSPCAMRPRTSLTRSFEIASLVLNGASPIAHDRAMSGNNALAGVRAALRDRRESRECCHQGPAHARRTADRRRTGSNSRCRRPSSRCRYARGARPSSVSVRPPRSICISSSTSSVGGTILTSSMSASPSDRRNAFR